MLILFFVAFMLIGRLIPPLSPTAGAVDIAHFLVANKLRVRIGLAVSLLVVCMLLPFNAVICLRIRRIEGQWATLSVTQIFAGVAVVPQTLITLMILAAAAFRPEQRPPELTQALDDLFWLMFAGLVGTAIVQALVLAAAAFIDSTDPPTFPRWFGYLNFWFALLAVPGGAVVVFNNGPLAWNGVFAFWIPLAAFGVWMVCTAIVMLRSIAAEADSVQRPAVATT